MYYYIGLAHDALEIDAAAADAFNLTSLTKSTMPERKTRGAFIVIEGLDRSGKSTQVVLLEERFKAAGLPVRLVKFPGT